MRSPLSAEAACCKIELRASTASATATQCLQTSKPSDAGQSQPPFTHPTRSSTATRTAVCMARMIAVGHRIGSPTACRTRSSEPSWASRKNTQPAIVASTMYSVSRPRCIDGPSATDIDDGAHYGLQEKIPYTASSKLNRIRILHISHFYGLQILFVVQRYLIRRF